MDSFDKNILLSEKSLNNIRVSLILINIKKKF